VAAYAVFVHKALPTAFQWRAAGGFGGPEIFSEILLLSNFGTKGPAAVGSHDGLSPWGALDLAGRGSAVRGSSLSTMRVQRGSSRQDGTLVLAQQGGSLAFRSGALQVGELLWGSSTPPILELGSKRDPRGEVEQIARVLAVLGRRLRA
jgi:hypothetical protein